MKAWLLSGRQPNPSSSSACSKAPSYTLPSAPIWLDAEDPLDPNRRLQRLLVAQDTGGAIRGIVRGDVFWGAGEDAAERAGRMRARGRFWVLLPVAVARRLDVP